MKARRSGLNSYLTVEERESLARVTVAIVGAGGLGSNCAAHLVRAGIRRLILADFDVVSESNLNRQFFFRDQIGEKKVEALATNLRRIEPDLDLTLVAERLDAEGVSKLIAPADIVVEAVDVAETKATLISLALAAGKKIVAASGMAGWGRSAAMTARQMGSNLVVVGDGETSVSDTHPPQSPRVGIAAAMEANSVLALILNHPV